MKNHTRTNLSCTDPVLIGSGSTFYQETEAEMLGANGSEIYYRAYLGTMHRELLELSKEHPDEKFIATSWSENLADTVAKITGIYINGKYNTIKAEPFYTFSYKKNLEADPELLDEFIEMISQRLEEIRESEGYSDEDVRPTYLDNLPDDNGIKVHLTFHWETRDHRFIGENKYGYRIDIRYENKDKENLERLRSENSHLRDQLDNAQIYNDLPF